MKKSGVRSQDCLGNSYVSVMKDGSPEEFDKLLRYWNGVEPDVNFKDDGRIYGFITSDGGNEIHPLYVGDVYYIMTDNGTTFENLTH
jgi:hypothetical protein